ncbi:Uncharacterised protein [Enterobacter cloacae]|nr:Uncharacterised protein [Enterobacter cloacae]
MVLHSNMAARPVSVALFLSITLPVFKKSKGKLIASIRYTWRIFYWGDTPKRVANRTSGDYLGG